MLALLRAKEGIVSRSVFRSGSWRRQLDATDLVASVVTRIRAEQLIVLTLLRAHGEARPARVEGCSTASTLCVGRLLVDH